MFRDFLRKFVCFKTHFKRFLKIFQNIDFLSKALLQLVKYFNHWIGSVDKHFLYLFVIKCELL